MCPPSLTTGSPDMLQAQKTQLDAIPTGLSCPGVHRTVIQRLLELPGGLAGKRILDVPCGSGQLIGTLRSFFPESTVRGCDIQRPTELASEDFATIDANRPFTVFSEQPFDVVLSVSGVMEFDNTLQFFETCYRHLRPGGHFIVTNDSGVTVWDRISYLLLGKTRQFEIFVNQGQPTWKVLPLHNMVRLLRDAGFRVSAPEYVSIERRNWALLPLALLIHPIQVLYTRRSRNAMPLAEKRAMYPFRSLLCRHYVVHCEKPLE